MSGRPIENIPPDDKSSRVSISEVQSGNSGVKRTKSGSPSRDQALRFTPKETKDQLWGEGNLLPDLTQHQLESNKGVILAWALL